MKHQGLFSLQDKSKKLKCRLLQFLFGTLNVKFLGCSWIKLVKVESCRVEGGTGIV